MIVFFFFFVILCLYLPPLLLFLWIWLLNFISLHSSCKQTNLFIGSHLNIYHISIPTFWLLSFISYRQSNCKYNVCLGQVVVSTNVNIVLANKHDIVLHMQIHIYKVRICQFHFYISLVKDKRLSKCLHCSFKERSKSYWVPWL